MEKEEPLERMYDMRIKLLETLSTDDDYIGFGVMAALICEREINEDSNKEQMLKFMATTWDLIEASISFKEYTCNL